MSNSVVNIYSTNSEICLALGLDPKAVSELTIHLKPGEAPYVSVKKFIFSDETKALKESLEKFRLVQDETPETNNPFIDKLNK